MKKLLFFFVTDISPLSIPKHYPHICFLLTWPTRLFHLFETSIAVIVANDMRRYITQRPTLLEAILHASYVRTSAIWFFRIVTVYLHCTISDSAVTYYSSRTSVMYTSLIIWLNVRLRESCTFESTCTSSEGANLELDSPTL